MDERKVAIQAMRKIAYRNQGVLLEDALNDKDKAALVNVGLFEWYIGTDVDGSLAPYLMLTDAGFIAHEFALGEKRWRRKWEIMRDRADDYYQKLTAFFQELKALQAQLQPQSKFKMTIGKIEYDLEVIETNGQR